jgi:hypothetical protein
MAASDIVPTAKKPLASEGAATDAVRASAATNFFQPFGFEHATA